MNTRSKTLVIAASVAIIMLLGGAVAYGDPGDGDPQEGGEFLGGLRGMWNHRVKADCEGAPFTGMRGGAHPWMNGFNFASSLSDEEIEQVKAVLEEAKELRESGASLLEVREFIEAELEELGITLPERPERPALTDEQMEALEELRQTIEQMKLDGASCEEIREYVSGFLEELGLDFPRQGARVQRFRGFRGGCGWRLPSSEG